MTSPTKRHYEHWFPLPVKAGNADQPDFVINRKTRILAIQFSLVCDANASNRMCSVFFRNSGPANMHRVLDYTYFIAGQTGNCYFVRNGESWKSADGLHHYNPLADLVLDKGDSLRLGIVNGLVGDSYTAWILYDYPDEKEEETVKKDVLVNPQQQRVWWQ